MSPHVPAERLAEVAQQDIRFTDEEFSHLKECSACFDTWAGFICDDFEQEARENFKLNLHDRSGHIE